MLGLLVFSTLTKESCFDEKMGHKNTTVGISYIFLAGLTLTQRCVSGNQILGAHNVLKLCRI